MESFNVWTMVITPMAIAVVGSGAMQVLISTFLTRRRLSVEQEFKDRERRSQAHETARHEHAERAARIYRLLDEIAWKVLGPEVGAFDLEPSTHEHPRSKAGEVRRLLREIWTTHPTKNVRRIAKELSDQLVSFYAEPPPDERGWPSPRDGDALIDHQTRAEILIEELHCPPSP